MPVIASISAAPTSAPSGAFDHAALEAVAGADEDAEFGDVDRAPLVLVGLHQLAGHRRAPQGPIRAAAARRNASGRVIGSLIVWLAEDTTPGRGGRAPAVDRT